MTPINIFMHRSHSLADMTMFNIATEEYHGLHNATTDRPMKKLTKWRNIFGFWILGLANNYPYVIMLSAAFDTIHRLSDKTGDHMHNNTNLSNMSSVDSCTLVNGSYKQRELCERAGTSVCMYACVWRDEGEVKIIIFFILLPVTLCSSFYWPILSHSSSLN